MATNPRRRQQKLERKAAKRKEKKHQLAREQSLGLAERLAAAARFPVLHAQFTEALLDPDRGIGWALLSRVLPDTSVAVSIFLIDRFCLGVKDTIIDIMTRSGYEDKFQSRMRREFPARNVSPACVRKLVESAVEYAQNLGFQPQADYPKAMALFGDINPAECQETFVFGKDGKPFFINGPFDDEARCRRIIATLMDRCGPGGFDYLIQVGDPDRSVPRALREGDSGASWAEGNPELDFDPGED
jgi:hypothetical protein